MNLNDLLSGVLINHFYTELIRRGLFPLRATLPAGSFAQRRQRSKRSTRVALRYNQLKRKYISNIVTKKGYPLLLDSFKVRETFYAVKVLAISTFLFDRKGDTDFLQIFDTSYFVYMMGSG